MSRRLKLWVASESGTVWLTGSADDSPSCRPAVAVDLTPELVAEYLDGHAESCNYHHFVGLHAYLADLVAKKAGPEAARAVMLELLNRGGLHG